MMYDIEADWVLNLLCNYDCEYCFSRTSTEHPLVGRMTPEQLLGFFNSAQKTWLFHLTGGEPFFYPDFVHLCRTLTSGHYISLNSNLCSRLVPEFAAAIDVSRVQYIHCGVHVEERDRRNGWRNLLTNVTSLVERGFPVFASLVMTPAAFPEFPRVEQSFTALGVPLIPKAIRGPYRGRWYPQAYTKTERTLFRWYSELTELTWRASSRLPDRLGSTVNPLLDRDYLDGLPDFTGIPCSAGRSFVSIRYDGVILRCGENTVVGNLLERRLDLFSEDRPCDDEYCPYWCMRYSRFKNYGPASYSRRQVPSGFQQPLVTIRGMRRDIGDRVATLLQPRP